MARRLPVRPPVRPPARPIASTPRLSLFSALISQSRRAGFRWTVMTMGFSVQAAAAVAIDGLVENEALLYPAYVPIYHQPTTHGASELNCFGTYQRNCFLLRCRWLLDLSAVTAGRGEARGVGTSGRVSSGVPPPHVRMCMDGLAQHQMTAARGWPSSLSSNVLGRKKVARCEKQMVILYLFFVVVLLRCCGVGGGVGVIDACRRYFPADMGVEGGGWRKKWGSNCRMGWAHPTEATIAPDRRVNALGL